MNLLEDIANAIAKKDATTVRTLLATGLIDVNAVIPLEQPLFKYASSMPHDILDWLLEAGADINGVDLEGQCALHDAAWAGDVELLKFLIARGADLGIAGCV